MLKQLGHIAICAVSGVIWFANCPKVDVALAVVTGGGTVVIDNERAGSRADRNRWRAKFLLVEFTFAAAAAVGIKR